jgi:hypothetical protein
MNDRRVIEILEKAIKEGGYDGLFLANTCACTLKDGLIPCEGVQPTCTMGYEIPGTGDYEGTFEVVRVKP